MQTLREHLHDLREAAKALVERVVNEVPYGDQWPEVKAMFEQLERE